MIGFDIPIWPKGADYSEGLWVDHKGRIRPAWLRAKVPFPDE